jgi:hypothetical protein
LAKSDPTTQAEVLRQPIFGNPLVTNSDGNPLEVSDLNKGCAFAISNCMRIKDLWDPEDREWKSLFAFRMNFHASNIISKEIIIASITWNPTEYPNQAQVKDWIYNKSSSSNTPLDLVYHVTQTAHNTVKAMEFQRISHSGIIKATSSQEITLST